MIGIIDRFEGKYAIVELENFEMKNIEITRLPKGATEGDVIVIENNKIVIDREKTNNRNDKISRLMKNIFE